LISQDACVKKTKILQYPPPLAAGGGVSNYMLNNIRYLDKAKFQFDFLSISKEPVNIPGELNELGCKLHYLSCYPSENKNKFIDELNLVFDESYDILHLHTSFWKGFLIEEIAVQRNIPVIIVHSHSSNIDVVDKDKRQEALEVHEEVKAAFNADLATHFCACSDKAADWLFGEQIPREKIIILNNAIDTERFSYKPNIRDMARKELDIEDSFVIGHIGRFSYAKNHEMLINIFNKVIQKVPNAKLMLIGTGELMENVVNQIENLGLSDKVLVLGYRNDTDVLLQAMDIFLLPSRFEGLGLVLIEAQSTGLKCLASEVVPREAKITSNISFLPDNLNAWIKKTVEIANGSQARTDMSETVAEAGYSLKEKIDILHKIYLNR